jgi:hypothetical protein
VSNAESLDPDLRRDDEWEIPAAQFCVKSHQNCAAGIDEYVGVRSEHQPPAGVGPAKAGIQWLLIVTTSREIDPKPLGPGLRRDDGFVNTCGAVLLKL